MMMVACLLLRAEAKEMVDKNNGTNNNKTISGLTTANPQLRDSFSSFLPLTHQIFKFSLWSTIPNQLQTDTTNRYFSWWWCIEEKEERFSALNIFHSFWLRFHFPFFSSSFSIVLSIIHPRCHEEEPSHSAIEELIRSALNEIGDENTNSSIESARLVCRVITISHSTSSVSSHHLTHCAGGHNPDDLFYLYLHPAIVSLPLGALNYLNKYIQSSKRITKRATFRGKEDKNYVNMELGLSYLVWTKNLAGRREPQLCGAVVGKWDLKDRASELRVSLPA